MTREEAISIIRYGFSEYKDKLSVYAEKRKLAFDMAIKALEQEPCDDAISRQAVIDATVKKNIIWNSITNSKGENLEEIISQLPPVTPQQKIGHWIDADGDNAICGCCNRLNHLYGTYCKHCGAKMLPTGSNCDSCKYHNEVDGSNCYECVKGICNNYKADSEIATEKQEHKIKEIVERDNKIKEILNKNCNDISKFIFIKELYENKRESEEEL